MNELSRGLEEDVNFAASLLLVFSPFMLNAHGSGDDAIIKGFSDVAHVKGWLISWVDLVVVVFQVVKVMPPARQRVIFFIALLPVEELQKSFEGASFDPGTDSRPNCVCQSVVSQPGLWGQNAAGVEE